MMNRNLPLAASRFSNAARNGALKSSFCQRGLARNRVICPRWTASLRIAPPAREHDILPRCNINASIIRITIECAESSSEVQPRNLLSSLTESEIIIIASTPGWLVRNQRSSYFGSVRL